MTPVPPTQPPAAPETDASGRLTAVERDVIRIKAAHGGIDTVLLYVEGIVAERVRVVEGERDAAEERLRDAYSCGEWADLIAERNREFRRAESAEAAHRALQARIDTLATGMLHEADHLDQLGDHEEAGSVRHYGHVIRSAALASPSTHTQRDTETAAQDVRDYRAAYSRCVDLAEEWGETRGMVAWDVAADLLDAALTPREDTP